MTGLICRVTLNRPINLGLNLGTEEFQPEVAGREPYSIPNLKLLVRTSTVLGFDALLMYRPLKTHVCALPGSLAPQYPFVDRMLEGSLNQGNK